MAGSQAGSASGGITVAPGLAAPGVAGERPGGGSLNTMYGGEDELPSHTSGASAAVTEVVATQRVAPASGGRLIDGYSGDRASDLLMQTQSPQRCARCWDPQAVRALVKRLLAA